MQQPPYQEYQYEKPPPYFEDNKAPPTWGGPNPPPPPPSFAHPQYPGGHGQGQTSYGAVIMEPVSMPVTQVILVGGCPACRVGVLEDSFSCIGVLCAILFFPLGLLCCLAMREKRCCNCGAVF